jgi:hypothetical protein
MGYNIGLPSLKLNNAGFKSKKCGDFKLVASEALSERKGRDMDIDPTRAALNEYEGFSTAKELIEYSENHVAEINQWRSEHGKTQAEKRALRADTVVMCAMIVKPPAELMESLTPEQQKQLLHDSVDFIRGVVGSDNVKAVAYHFDELVPHAHIFWEPNAGEGRLCAKELHNTKNYFRPINKGLPAHLRSKGWTMIDDCNAYDAAKEQELREEMGAEDYAKHRAAVKAKRGQDSKTFKHQADKEVAEKIAIAQEQERLAEQARQQRIADERASAEALAEADKAEQERRENAKKNTELQQRQSTLLHNVGTLEQREKYLAENVESLVKNEEGCRRTIDNLEEKITSLTASQEALTSSVDGLQQKADSLSTEVTEAEQKAENARSELSDIITQTEQQQSKLTEIQDKALSYETSEKKHFGESPAAYNDRIATAQQAVAIAQRTEALNERESKLDARDAEQDSREKNIAWREKNIDAIAQSRAEKLAAKPIADARQETAIVKRELTAERTAHTQTRTKLADAIARLRDALLALFPPYWKNISQNAHQKHSESLRRGESYGDLARRQRYQPTAQKKSQSEDKPRIYQHR